MELYKKYRPKRLSSVIGCERTVASLTNMLARKSVPHALLFHGPSGCGKTTIARILRKEMGCHDMDWNEINSSSFRGIDSIRDVNRLMGLAPSGGTCRIWLFDEVHKWTNDAQNAALKMLEDTPQHVWFFLCTTDPQKLLKPVMTRCCEMPVRSFTYEELTKLVKKVARKEELVLSDEALDELVSAAQGSARMALVLLDKILNLSPEQQVKAIADRMAAENEAIDLCRALLNRNSKWNKVTNILKDLKVDPEAVRWSVLGYARAVLLKGGKPDHQAYLVIRAFEEPFYDSKEAGLAAACFDALYGE